jgi:hypothetical protein
MPGWKINCLKSEDTANPSTSLSNATEEQNKIESTPSPIDHQNTGKNFKIKRIFFKCLSFVDR